ncbi:hypothetical protein Tco_1580828, partial [Tanacetum coccineum]
MPPMVMTRSAGRPAAIPRGGRTGGQVGGQGSEVNYDVDGVPDFSTIIAQQLQNLLPTILAQLGNQCSNQGNPRNQNGDAVNDNIQGLVSNVIVNNNQRGCTYKEFLACPYVVELSDPLNEMQKLETEFWNHAMVGVSHAAYTNRFHELARLVPHLVTPENKKRLLWLETFP